MVMLTTTLWPGWITAGENVVAGLVAASSMSPVSEVTVVSNAFVATCADMLTVPAGAAPGTARSRSEWRTRTRC